MFLSYSKTGGRKAASFLLAAFIVCCASFSGRMTVYAASLEELELEQEAQKALPVESNDIDNWPAGPVTSAQSAILMNVDTGAVLYAKNIHKKSFPASTTKILTCLVAMEQGNLDDTVTFSTEAVFSVPGDGSNMGMDVGEAITMEQCLYGILVGSANEVANAVGEHIAGSIEGFVDLMNEKLEELGLSESAHFTNCVGVYDDDHYCTPYDMAVIMRAALENDLCRQVLSAKTYTTSETEEHPEGMMLSNWFLRRIEDKDVGDNVKSGKTGYVEESGSCAVSYGESKDGKRYICVTADAQNQWRCIDDHAEIYRQVM